MYEDDGLVADSNAGSFKSTYRLHNLKNYSPLNRGLFFEILKNMYP